MYPILFNALGYPVNSWTLMAGIGTWVGFFSFRKDMKRKGISDIKIGLFLFGCIPVWLMGAHQFYLWTVGPVTPSPNSEFSLFGFVLYGGMLSCLIYGLITHFALEWYRKLRLRELLDFGVLAICWVFFFGRIGCTLYGCCYGTPAGNWPGFILDEPNWDIQNGPFPIALRGIKLHPAPLYEAIGLLLTALMILGLRKLDRTKPVPVGLAGGLGLMLYSTFRFFLEYIRWDLRGSGALGLTPSQLISLGILTIGAIAIPAGFVFLPKNTRRPIPSPSMKHPK